MKMEKKQEKIISVDEIKIDDVLRVLPGEKIPVDGIVIDGDSSIDQSVITGESLPVDKSDGDEVFCGTLNMYGVLDIKTTSLSENSSLQKLIDLVKQADEKQAPTQRIADKWATWLVPVALIIAAAAWVATGNIERGVTVLVVFCPCALILATPTAVMAAIGQATKHGILIKSGEALENLGELNTITFDKTGTLTYGDLKVSDIIPTGDFIENEVLAIASAVENLSEHPLAKAIADKANDENIAVEKVSNFKMYPGRGVFGINSKGKIYAGNLNYIKENFEISDKTNTYLDNLNSEGKAIIIVGLNNQVIGIIALSDVIREESQSVVENLHELGVKTVILTGDNVKTANYFAKQVGISEVHGNLLPNEKLQWVEKFKKSENKVCMVGDGVNDAPALKTANVSVAMGSIGSDIAIDAADIALLGDDIEKIPYLKRLSNSTLFTIKFNIALSMMINAIAIICSVLGLLNPVTGAIVHNAGSCLVVLNAALLYDRNFDKNSRFSERGIFYAAVDNRVDDGGLAVVRGKTVHDSEHRKAYETQENRNYQPERLRFHAADAHFETFFHGHTRFNKSERFVIGNFYRVFVGGGKRLHFPVCVDVRRGFYVGVDLLVKRQIRLVPFKIFVDTLYVVGGQPVPFRETQKFPLVVFRAALFHFGVNAVFFDVGNYFAVFKFDHPVAVGLGKFAVVRNDDDKFVL